MDRRAVRCDAVSRDAALRACVKAAVGSWLWQRSGPIQIHTVPVPDAFLIFFKPVEASSCLHESESLEMDPISIGRTDVFE